MAGSYLHCIKSDGSIDPDMMLSQGRIESLGDAYEAIEELYGMIWVLAIGISDQKQTVLPPATYVEWARKNYQIGIDADVRRKLATDE